MSEKELLICLLGLRNGNQAAFEKIYSELKNPIYTIILRITKNRTQSEDIFQEVFVKLYQSPPKPSIKKPRAYLFAMARNLAIDSMRKQMHTVNIEDIENAVHAPPNDLPLKMDIDDALKSLVLQECEIVTLHINGGLKFREIAEIMNMPLGTVLWKYQKSISKLRSILSGGAI